MPIPEPHLGPDRAARFQKRIGPARVGLAGARAAYVGPPLDLAPHRNAAATLAIGLEAPFTLTLPGAPPAARTIALIPPGTRHHLHATGRMAFLYLDALGDDLAALQASDLHAARVRLLRHGAIALATADPDALCAALALPRRPAGDPRIARVLHRLNTDPDSLAHAAQAAALAGLSASRFQAVFRTATGVPFRRYRLWRRLAAAFRATETEPSLTHAALAAGFSSSAHLSAAFKTMFGLSPSALLAPGAAGRNPLASVAGDSHNRKTVRSVPDRDSPGSKHV